MVINVILQATDNFLFNLQLSAADSETFASWQ
jgi:hypothetical protein